MHRYFYRKLQRINVMLQNIKLIGFNKALKLKLARHGTLFQVTLMGHRIHLRSQTPDLDVAKSSLCGEFEMLRHLLPRGFDGYIVDAGAYIGTAAIALNDLFPSAKILCIEPATDNLSVLFKNVCEIPNIIVLDGALTCSSKDHVMLHDRGTGEWGYSIVDYLRDAENQTGGNVATAISLRDLTRKYPGIRLLKLDIEGGEKELLKNCKDTLDKIDVVFAELHDRIVKDCTMLFFEFSESRIVIKDKAEKYLSIRKHG